MLLPLLLAPLLVGDCEMLVTVLLQTLVISCVGQVPFDPKESCRTSLLLLPTDENDEDLLTP